eukprot:scaffold22351_cov66-Phaeocystis_antarctica.AAC.2
MHVCGGGCRWQRTCFAVGGLVAPPGDHDLVLLEHARRVGERPDRNRGRCQDLDELLGTAEQRVAQMLQALLDASCCWCCGDSRFLLRSVGRRCLIGHRESQAEREQCDALSARHPATTRQTYQDGAPSPASLFGHLSALWETTII